MKLGLALRFGGVRKRGPYGHQRVTASNDTLNGMASRLLRLGRRDDAPVHE
jgi:hypothetical protein